MYKLHYVYRLHTTACNKCYIGITTNPERRLRQHLNVARHKWKTLTKCGRAVKRYGADTFSMTIMYVCYEKNECRNMEKKIIKRFGMKRLWNENKGGAGPK